MERGKGGPEQRIKLKAMLPRAVPGHFHPLGSARFVAQIFTLGMVFLLNWAVTSGRRGDFSTFPPPDSPPSMPQTSGVDLTISKTQSENFTSGTTGSYKTTVSSAGSSAGDGSITVSLNWVDGVRGDPVVLSLQLDNPDGVNIGSVESEISFPTELISFVSAKRSPSSARVGAAIKTELKPDPGDPEKTILEMGISPPPVIESPAKPLPNGVLADLSFQIAENAEFGWISLALKSKAWTSDTPPRPVQAVVTMSGKIHVIAKGMFSCFFYMH